MSEYQMQVHVVPDSTNPDRPFLVQMRGVDGVWQPFGNEESQRQADMVCDTLVAMYGESLGLVRI